MNDDDTKDTAAPADTAALVAALSNGDVRWDGSLLGLVPAITAVPAQRLLALGDRAVAPLVAALHDEQRFVAAHVLLTLLSGVSHQGTPWNGLAVELDAANRVRIDAGQRAGLARRWAAWQHAMPRPAALPPD